jgi:hypothetical protein
MGTRTGSWSARVRSILCTAVGANLGTGDWEPVTEPENGWLPWLQMLMRGDSPTTANITVLATWGPKPCKGREAAGGWQNLLRTAWYW